MINKQFIAGVDEVGRGCLAGPVVSAAVIFKEGYMVKGIKDSKKLSFRERFELAKKIKKVSYYAIGVASVEEIFKLNILNASLLSMSRAVKGLKIKPKKILVDGIFTIKGLKNCKAIVKGDQKIRCISAASIIAKTFRDSLMIKLSDKKNLYNWKKNFGYGTKEHLDCIERYGVTNFHRKGFKPIHNILLKKNRMAQ